MYKKWNLFIILTLLLGLVFTSPTQTVLGATADLTIEPSFLPDWEVTVNFQLQLVARYVGGSECSTGCTWYTTLGELPEGVTINGDTGYLQGAPTTIGTYTFTVMVDDHKGMIGSQQYTWNITQVKTRVNVGDSSTYVGTTVPTTLGATAQHPNPYYSPQPTGKISFSVNGVPVPGCSGENALTTNSWGQAYCTSYIPATELTAGSYDIKADFTPDVASSVNYMSGSGTGSLQVNPAQTVISGRVFLDDNKNQVYDENEVTQGVWEVYLNQDCDNYLEGNVVTDSITGAFSFEPVPSSGHTYCLFVDLSGYEGSYQTTPFNNLTFENPTEFYEIGIYYPHMSIFPELEQLPSGSVGSYYEQVFQVSGGAQPYSEVSIISEMPGGLTFDSENFTLSGIPTEGGFGNLYIKVVDQDGLTAERTYWFIIQFDGDFLLESSLNPSEPDQEVTFTLSGSGDAVDPMFGAVPPYGIVTFLDGDDPIEGCEQTILNFNFTLEEVGNYPATCKTIFLTEGQHIITAIFTNPYSVYSDTTRSLTQQVGTTIQTITISPETPAVAAFQTPYSQQLTASGGVEPYTFTLQSGTLPSGISLNSGGLLSGFADLPAAPGTYPITVQVNDANGAIASRDYDFVLDKAIPTVTTKADAFIYWNNSFKLMAEVLMKISDTQYAALDGTVAFFIDDTPVPGCGAVTKEIGYYQCTNVSMNLSVGTHSLRAEYTPTGWYTGYYYPATGSNELTVRPVSVSIPGSLFLDANKNGILDDGEMDITESGWTVNLDQGCDGVIDYSIDTSYGNFIFTNIPVSGQCHRIALVAEPGYQQMTQLEDFYPVPGTVNYFEVGFYYPTIIISPSGPGIVDLTNGTIGVDYNQSFNASGGTGPYLYSVSSGNLPDGLSLSTEGILSGIPTKTGNFYFVVKAMDVTQASGYNSYSLTIDQVKVDGDFTFISSSNPSVPGEAVIFTVSASGSVETPFGALPPVGYVEFFADGDPIDGCSSQYLNLQFDENWVPIFDEYPATCTTTALGEGSHLITAVFYDLLNAYNQPTLELIQEVSNSTVADLAIEATDSKNPVKPGSKLTYTLMVSNRGTDQAETVLVTDKLDVTTTFLSISAPRGWACIYAENSGTVTCTSDSLASGSSAIIKITVLVNKTAKVGKELVNNAFVSSSTFDPDLTNNSVVQKTLVAK